MPSGGGSSTVKKHRKRSGSTSNKTSTSKKVSKSSKKSAPSTSEASEGKRYSPRTHGQLRRQQDELGTGTTLLGKLDAAAQQVTQPPTETSSEDEMSKDLLEESQVPSSQPLPPKVVMMAGRNPAASQLTEDPSFANHDDPLVPSDASSGDASDMSPSDVAQSRNPVSNGTGTDESFNCFDPAFDHTAQGFPFAQRVHHTLRGQVITKKIRTPVEIAVLCEAYRLMIEEKGQMKSGEQHAYLARMYAQVMGSLDDKGFAPGLKEDMVCRRKGSNKDSGLVGSNLKRQYGEIRSIMRKIHGDFPSNFATIPSGKQLHQLIDDHITKTFQSDVYVSVLIISLVFILIVDCTNTTFFLQLHVFVET